MNTKKLREEMQKVEAEKSDVFDLMYANWNKLLDEIDRLVEYEWKYNELSK